MGLAVEKVNQFTYTDYVGWDDNERWELIAGEAYNMTPAPTVVHQEILMELLLQLGNPLKGTSCKVFPAPLDVRLPLADEKEGDIKNVVQPDISVICDKSKLDEKGCLGAPDMTVEIISPSTSRKDRMEKFFLYEKVGVKEYWLVYPLERIVEVFSLGADGRYGRPGLYNETDALHLSLLPGVTINLALVFPKTQE